MIKPLALSLATLLPIPETSQAQSLPLTTSSGIELGLQISDYKYEEQFKDAFLMSTAGIKWGLSGSYTDSVGNGWYCLGDARFAWGELAYKGTGSRGGNPDLLFDGRLIAGRDFEKERYLLSPYAGLGYRLLYNDLRGVTSTGAGGYRRSSEYFYLPLGLTQRFRSGSDARISSSLEYDHLIEGKQKTYLSDSTSQYDDAVNIQKNGYGVRLGANYETASWSLGVFFQYWNIKDSERSVLTSSGVPVGTVLEPRNTTTELGVQVKYRFD